MNRQQRRIIRQALNPGFSLTVYKFDLWLIRLACIAIIYRSIR